MSGQGNYDQWKLATPPEHEGAAECDHEWEYLDYDPSVGAFGGKTCAKCEAEEPDERGSESDDNYF